MIRVALRILCIFSTALISPHITAECIDSQNNRVERCDRGGSFYIDQDMLIDSIVPKNDDRDYTMGMAFAAHGRRVRDYMLYNIAYDFNDYVEERIFEYSDDLPTLHSVYFGNTAFTPNLILNLSDQPNSFSDPVEDDRPFANLLFFASEKTVLVSPNEVHRNTVVFGVLGLDIGKAVQRQFHCDWKKGNPCPQGWNNQISDGGEPTVLYKHRRMQNVTPDSIAGLMDISTYKEIEVGYYTDVAAGFLVRFGYRRSLFYDHAFNGLEVGVKNTFHSMESQNDEEGKAGYDLYTFFGAGARAFLYNSLLQGQFRDNPHEFRHKELRPVIAELTAGLVTPLWCDMRLTYAANYRSSQIKDGTGDREHWYAGLYLDWRFSTR